MTEEQLRLDFYTADTIRKRIVIKRHAYELGYAKLTDEFLKSLVPFSK